MVYFRGDTGFDDTAFKVLHLSAELRNKIYSLVLLEDKALRAITFPAATQPLEASSQFLYICRQIRNEVKGIFWSGNLFEVRVPTQQRQPQRWLEMIGMERAKLITNFKLKTWKLGCAGPNLYIGTSLRLPPIRNAISAMLDLSLPTNALGVCGPFSLQDQATPFIQANAKKRVLFQTYLPRVIQGGQKGKRPSTKEFKIMEIDHLRCGEI